MDHVDKSHDSSFILVIKEKTDIFVNSLIGRMLIREPEKRATLEQIAADPWLLEGAGATAQLQEHLPLISRHQVSDEDHAIIIQKMVNGNIATKEQILE